jgi:DNA-binding MarR family transcriptional regulator
MNRLIDVDHEDAVLRTFILFVQTAQAVLKYTDAHLYRAARLSIVKLVVLRALASHNGVMIPSEIAKWTQTERHNITTLIDRMKKEGLVTSEQNNKDKRSVNITLTEKGREVLMQAMPVAREIVDQVMSSITDHDTLLLEKLLRGLRQNTYNNLRTVDTSR